MVNPRKAASAGVNLSDDSEVNILTAQQQGRGGGCENSYITDIQLTKIYDILMGEFTLIEKEVTYAPQEGMGGIN